MPTKKKVTKKSKKSTKAQAPVAPPDPLKPEYVPPPPKPGEQVRVFVTVSQLSADSCRCLFSLVSVTSIYLFIYCS